MSTSLTIGMAACSSEGAALCYRTICARAPTLLGPHDHPEIVLHAPSLARYVDALEGGDLSAVADMMLCSARCLQAAGADFVICPDNTIHQAIPLFADRSPLPWLHIAEIVVAEARRRNFRKAAVLGTKWLMEAGLYPEALEKAGIQYLLPEPQERDQIGRIIMNELVNDVQKDSSVRYFQDLIARMKERGCDCVILGCTEIPLIIGDANSTLPTLDSTSLLADAALRHAIAPIGAVAKVPNDRS